MRIVRSVSTVCFPLFAIACMTFYLITPVPVHAQLGYNAVCTASSSTTGIACSATTFDASQFGTATSDICTKIFDTISTSTNPNYPATGAIVDARSINTGLTCSGTNETPWTTASGSVVTTPSVILLPAGLITISTGWVVPDRTRIIGQGERANPGAMKSTGTQIVASSTLTGTMISLGSSGTFPGTSTYPCGGSATGICFGVSISYVMLTGNSDSSLVGISNTNSQELSYVDHVNLSDIQGTGLSVSTQYAQNSGPYSNIACNPGSTYSTSTTCVSINGTLDLRGVHGLTATVGSDGCTQSPASCPTAALYLDANSTTIEDAHFEGFAAGILVGDSASAKGDVIFNVNGGGSTATGPTFNVVEISSDASDVSIMGVTTAANPSGYPSPNSIDDTLTGATISDSHVALYAIGESLGSGYTRFTTSSDVPTWGVGSGAPTGSCKVGSLFSNTSGASSTSTLYLCAIVSGSPAWVAH